MKTLHIILLLLLLLLAMLTAPARADESAPSLSANADAYVIRHVNVLDVAQQLVLPDQRVWIDNQLIIRIEPDTSPVETSVRQVQGHNGYLTPGLMDMHMHAWDPAAFAINLSYGITHVRIMNGVPQHLVWRQQLADQSRFGSTVTVSSPILSGYQDTPLHRYIGSREQAREAVASAASLGYDLLKIYGSLGAEGYAWVREFADKAGIAIAKHGPHPAGLQAGHDHSADWSSLRGLQSLEHVEDIFQGPLNHLQDADKLTQTIQALADLQVPVTPTLAIYQQLTRISAEKDEFIDSMPKEYISPLVAWFDSHNQVQRWLDAPIEVAEHNRQTLAYLLEITARLHQAGVPILAGSDAGVLLSPHGQSLHQELALLRQAGLSEFEVLRTATLNPARSLGKAKELGQIKAGLRADMIYTRANPLDDLSLLSHPEAVIKQGQWFDANALKQQRRQAIANRSLFDEATLLLSNM